MGSEVLMSTQLREQLLHFLEHHPARRLSVNLRTMLLEFLMFEGAIESPYPGGPAV
ncbi:MAG: hypothetical protein WDN75_19760 [Bacteroidota bacterium]